MTRRSRDPSASNTTDAAEQDQGPCPGGHLGTLHRSCVPPGVAVSIWKAPKRAARCRRGDVSRRLHALRGHPGTHADLASLFSPVVEREKLETRSHATLAEILTPLSATYPEVHVRRYVVEGSPVEQLEKLSANARLLVVGSRGLSPLSALVLGSVSARPSPAPTARLQSSTRAPRQGRRSHERVTFRYRTRSAVSSDNDVIGHAAASTSISQTKPGATLESPGCQRCLGGIKPAHGEEGTFDPVEPRMARTGSY